MKTPEEIKALLREHRYRIYNIDAIMADALTYIKLLEAQAPKWISVEEQEEPGEEGEYICCGYWFGSGKKQVETAVYSGEWEIVNNFVLTHWMPLPEPPKED